MKLQYRAAEDFLRKPDPKITGVLIYGPDEGQVRERVIMLAPKIVTDPADPFLLTELSGDTVSSDPARLNDEVNSLSLLGGRKLIIVRDASDKVASACGELKGQKNDNFVIVEGGDLPPKSSLRKLFEASPYLATIACYIDDEASLSRLIIDTLRMAHLTVDHDAVAYLSSSLIGDRALVRQELEKLIVFMNDAKNVTLDDAMAAIGDSAELLLDNPVHAAADGNRTEVDRALSKLFAEGTSPIAILRTSQTYFRRLHLARSAIDRGQSVEAALTSLRPPIFFKQASQFRRQVEQWTLPMIGTALTRLIDCEAAVKKTGAPDLTLTSRTFILIAQSVSRR